MKTSLKKFRCAAALAAAMLMAVAGCSNGGTTAETTTTAATQAPETTTTTAAEETTTTAASSEDTTAVTEYSETTDADSGTSSNIKDYIADGLGVQPALWKASDPATGNSIYLFGTIHVTLDGVSPITDYVAEAMDDSDVMTVEFDTSKITTDMNLLQEYQAGLIYSDGTLISDHLSEETYSMLVDFADMYLGGWQDLYAYYNTGFWMSQISAVTLMGAEGLDVNASTESYIIAKAEESGKEMRNVETMAECLAYVNAYTDDFADYVIGENLSTISEGSAISETLSSLADVYTAWATGDLEAVDDITYAEFGELPEDLIDDAEEYWDIMYYNRNAYMAERAAQYIKDGEKCFFTVGFAHYAGEKGIIALLTDMGYTVERLH